MSSLFPIFIALAASVGVLSALLIWRTRKVSSPPALPCGCDPAELKDEPQDVPAPGLLARFLAVIDFISTKKEWRYSSPWILVLGQEASGKTSLLDSVSTQFRQMAQGHQLELAIKGTTWYFFGEGFLIDPIGKLPVAAAEDTKNNNNDEWKRVLDQLDELRPERALDGILVVISAKSLLFSDAEQRLNIAENTRQQLRMIGERFEFSLPVYVVVTATDAVEGFAEFWRSQPEYRCNEMVGWSAPTQFTDELPEKWADTAFDYISQQLKALQVDTAAHVVETMSQDLDEFFTFPRHFNQLHQPFQQWIAVVFQRSAWKNTSFCRGIYFTGSIAASTATSNDTRQPRSDVSFVNDLLLKKVLAEPLLGRPTRVGIWSRNKIIRSLQIAIVVALSSLVLALWFSVIQANSQIDRLIQSIKTLDLAQKTPTNDPGCINKDVVFEMIRQVSKVNPEIHYLSLPLSYIDPRLSEQSATRTADTGFRKFILPGLACQLNLKATQLVSGGKKAYTAQSELNYFRSKTTLFGYVQEVTDYEKNSQFFERLIGAKPSQDQEDLLKEFLALSEYAYGASIPADIKSQSGVLPKALAILGKRKYSQELSLQKDVKDAASNAIVLHAKQLQPQLTNPSDMGRSTLKKVQDFERPLSTNAKEFSQWLNWMRESWTSSSSSANPILETENALAEKLKVLTVQYGYSGNLLNQASQQFDAKKNYPIAMKALSTLELRPYGRLFVQENQKITLNQNLVKELDGLIALGELNFMQIQETEKFVCQSVISGWLPRQIDNANNYTQEYQNFVRNQGLLSKNDTEINSSNQAALYELIALHQLQEVLNDSVQKAQIVSSTTQKNSTEMTAISPESQQQNLASSAFSKIAPSIQKLQQVYSQYNFNDNVAAFPQCVQSYAAKNLLHIKNLASKAQLYRPALNNSTGQDELFFSMGSSQDIKDYLALQFSQVQTFASYATPFLSYLQNQRNIANPACPSNKIALSSNAACNIGVGELYWSRTIDEINAYLPTKDSNAQVTLLENVFLTVLPRLSSKTCSEILGSYNSPAIGNGLFSFSRQDIELQVNDSCKSQKNKQANSLYDSWAKRFNEELSHTYPFSDVDTKIEASPIVVRTFFSDYEAKSADISQLISNYEAKISDSKKTLTDAEKISWTGKLEFIQQLNSVAKLFHGNLVNDNGGGSSNNPTSTESSNLPIKLNVNFNAQATASPGSDQIVNWSLSSGAKTISYPNNGTSLDWLQGQVLTFDLVWANQSKWSPSSNGGQSDLQIDGATATFSASGDWAIFRFIDRHRQPSGAATTSRDPSRVVLEFAVPVASTPGANSKTTNATAKLYLALNLSSKDPKTQVPVNLKLPAIFPRQAPQ
ncbi:type VI secretion protein IcmF/TssM N-terminal domain-containing protein [Undibacterium sp. Xuan67W]|uniref:type VI secretion protein IcmF/TssM N-terminal domain-containing protein n=1 Tax=Undibacterium sp. Xuan67W TaxID=3413057 RepID=UPI003BF3A1E1